MPPGTANANKFGFAIVSAETNQVETFPVAPSTSVASPTDSIINSSEEEDEGQFDTEDSGDRREDGQGTPTPTFESSILFSQSLAGRLPRLARSFSMPVAPSHLGHLRPPLHRHLAGSTVPPQSMHDEFSHELADAVQGIIQTLLHTSPPHLLDPVKEQFSACTVQLPTPSVSSLFTTMKNLNYMSANLRSFMTDNVPHEGTGASTIEETGTTMDTFDIGEVVQSVGDVLGGTAAQSGVDLVLYHGDVGMKHINVMGDECCILFVLTHVSSSSFFLEIQPHFKLSYSLDHASDHYRCKIR